MRGLNECYPLGTPVSFYFLVWRRPESGDRSERGTAVGLPLRLFRKIFAVHRQRTAAHTVYSPQARQKVNCPKGKRRSHGYDLGAPFLTICKRNRRGQHSAIAFIFHSTFSILHFAHAQFKQTAKKERSPDRSFVFRSISMRPFPSRI